MLAAFVKGDPAKAAGLAAAIQKLADTHKDKGLKTFVVFTGGPELVPAVQKVAAEKNITIPLTVLPKGTGAADFGQYKINPEAQNTILLYRRQQVVANFVNVTHESWPRVERAAAELLGQ